MFIINFIKSLFLPSKMVKYRTMSIIISIAIFLIASYVLAYPHTNLITNKRYEIVDKQNAYGLNIFKDLSQEDIDVLRSTEFKVRNLASEWSESLNQDEPYVFNINKEKQSVVTIAFDLYDPSDPDQKSKFDFTEYNKKEKDENIDYYLVVFYKSNLVYMSPDQDIKLPLSYYSGISIDLSTIKDGSYLSYLIMDLYLPSIKTEITFNTFISCVLLTFLIILILWVFFRTSGTIYSLNEFYNIGAIASILPLFVIFVLSWVFPTLQLFTYFTTVFGIYYLIMILLINKNSKIA